MNDEESLEDFPLAWSFHRNTSRWAHNAMTSSDQDDIPEPGKEYPNLPFTRLPEAQTINSSFSQLLERRCSCRDFSGNPVPLQDIATLLHYSMGVWGRDYWGGSEFLERPIPSGGGMYPLEMYILSREVSDLPAAIYHYVPLLHGLEQIRDVKVPEPLLKYLFMGQYPVIKASAILVIAAEVRRQLKKYGDRGYRYLMFEAGHVAQNINLACVGLGLQSLNLGGFFDDELSQLCRLVPDREIALYAIAVGDGVSQSKHTLRFSE